MKVDIFKIILSSLYDLNFKKKYGIMLFVNYSNGEE